MERTIVALDLSTKPGWARFLVKDGEVQKLQFDTIFPKKEIKDYGHYPFNYVDFARELASHLVSDINLIHINHPEVEVVIEETTAGKNNYSQKILEFIHYAVLTGLQFKKIPAFYIRTGTWRAKVGANLNDEEKKLNAKIRRIKNKTGEKLAKIDGKVVGKRTKKHASLRCFKEHFGYELPLNMNDACEAVLIGLAYIKGAPVCDGTTEGGTRESE
jgi:hypothetical protein